MIYILFKIKKWI